MWDHKKLGKNFIGSYDKAAKSGERIFNLSNGKRIISFESWQAAKYAGWVKR